MITIFTSCYNQGKFLEESIDSVLTQTFRNFEYLLYDDGSTDDTWKIIEKYAKIDKRIIPIKLDKQPNVSHVVNHSIELSRGDAWSWCPGDDVLLPSCLEEHYDFMQSHPNAVSSNQYVEMSEDGAPICSITESYTTEELKLQVWKSSPINFVGIMIPMSVFARVGPFPLHHNYSEDFWWSIKATIDGVEFHIIPKILNRHRGHPNSTTGRNRDVIIGNMTNIWNELRKYRDSI